MFKVELVEGKEEPDVFKAKKRNIHGNTVGLLLRLCTSLYGTGKLVVLDSGFCVLKALIELKKLGVFSHAVIKKALLAKVYTR